MIGIEDASCDLQHDVLAIRNLWASVIRCAADDLAQLGRASSAWRWIESDSMNVGSFRWVCVTLDLGVERTRAALESEKHRNSRRWRAAAHV